MLLDELDTMLALLRGWVTGLGEQVLDGADAAELVARFAKVERLAAAGRALAARRVADTNGWKPDGSRSAADWVADKTKTSPAQASASLETTERLENLPATKEAFTSGQITEAQAAEIASAAHVDPSAEQGLLDTATSSSMSELRRAARDVRAAAQRSQLEDRERAHRSRYLRHWTTRDGAFEAHCRLTADQGALLVSALDVEHRWVYEQARSEGRHEPAEAYRADALVNLARNTLDGFDPAPEGSCGGGDAATSSTPPASRAGSGGDPSHPAEPTTDPPHTASPVAPDTSTNLPGPRGSFGTPDGAPGGGIPDDGVASAPPAETNVPEVPPNRAPQHSCPTPAPPTPTPPAPTSPAPTSPAPSPPGTPHSTSPTPAPATPGAATDPAHAPVPTPPATTPPAATGDAGPPPRRARLVPTVTIRVDHTALVRGWTQPGEVCEIAGIGPIPVETARAYTRGDAVIRALLVDGERVIDARSLGRTIPTRLRIALEERDRTCVVPGCTSTRYLEIHHLDPFALGGETSLRNTCRICTHHHDQITYGHAELTGSPGHWTWTQHPPDPDYGPFDDSPTPAADRHP